MVHRKLTKRAHGKRRSWKKKKDIIFENKHYDFESKVEELRKMITELESKPSSHGV